MVNKYFKSFGIQASAALLLACAQAVADDTEIYTGTPGDGAPLVFFHIEYSPNLGSVICAKGRGILEDDPATPENEDNIDTTCPEIAPLKSYMAANDIVKGVDDEIDQFELTRAALKRVLIELGHDTYAIKVGLLMAHADLASCSGGPSATKCSQGGYILKGLTRLMAKSATFDPASATRAQVAAELLLHPEKKAMFDKLDALPSPQGGFSHPNQSTEVYFELFRYLTGQGIYNGHNGWVDFGTKDTFNLGDLSFYSPAKAPYDCPLDGTCTNANWLNGTLRFIPNTKSLGTYNGDMITVSDGTMNTKPFQWDTTIETNSNTTYSAALTTACEKVYVINVVDGEPIAGVDSQTDTAIMASLSSGGMGITNLNQGKVSRLEKVVAWLRDKDLADGTIGTAPNLTDIQNVTSYFVAKHPGGLDQAAQYGGTGFAFQLKDDAASVASDILAIFKSIIDASTTFTSAAIPVNVFNRSEVVDNAYIALFQPDGDEHPRWVGNVKKLKMDIYVQCNVFDAKDPTKCIQSENRLRMTETRTEVLDGKTIGMNAISDTTGRVVPEALTYWTNPAGYDLYDNIGTTNGENEVAGRDGRSVHRGGAGQKIPRMLGTTADASGHLPRGLMNWTNTSEGRRLFTEPDDGSAPHSALLPLEWNNISTLWPHLYNTATDDNYDVAAQWQTPYTSTGTPTTLSASWDVSKALFNQNPTLPTTTVKKYYNSDGTVAEVNGAEFKIEHLTSKLLAFMRGFDANDDDADGDILESRRWLFGDPLHSRPLAMNYGTLPDYTEDDPATPDVNESNPDIRIVVGSNDGYLRMLKNTGTGTGQTAEELGEEVWAFMPREAMKIQKQLMDNSAASLPDHPYGTDGAPSYFIRDTDGTIGYCKNSSGTLVACSTDQAWVYFGMRRGGRAYYALDITNPDNPKFLWKITNNTPGFSELGYTFAQPVVRELKYNWEGSVQKRPVVIFGGGYDLNKDNQTPLLGSNDTMGRAIYIVDAETGTLVWKADSSNGLTDSIPSKVTAVDSTGDAVIDRIYVGDTGGRVWRVDLPSSNTSDWTVRVIMNVGRHDPQWTTTADQTANDRRFFYAPDVIPTLDGKGNFDAVVIGSGNREHPRQTQTTDYVYMYKDRCITQSLGACTGFVGPVTMTNTISATSPALYDVTDNCIQENGGDCAVDPDLTYGWKLKLESLGEKLLSPTLTVRGVVYFSSYLPKIAGNAAGACMPAEGEGYSYAVALQDAVAVFDYDKTNTVVILGKEYTLQKTDRKRKLDSPGIPAENVYVAYKDETGKTINCVLGSDLNCGQDIGVQQWSSYWYESQK